MASKALELRIVDDVCDRFERARKSGTASLVEYLHEAPRECSDYLLSELVAIELHYRCSALDRKVTLDDVVADHPELADDIERCVQVGLIAYATDNESFDTTGFDTKGAASSDPAISDVVLATQSDSHGLQIRCPHCCNPVELLVDNPSDEVTCRTCGSTFSLAGGESVDASSSALRTIGRFALLARLGVGGFGTVWKAHDQELDRTVALKIPRRGQLRQNEVEYFFREARAAAQLQHPQIVAVHEIGREDDTVFIVSDFVQGVTLSDWMTEQRIGVHEIARLCATIADGLHHAHQHGVIHRDLKPSNVMIDEQGEPRIVDFGLAKRDAGEVTMTMEGQVLGTAAYMSPEQAGGQSHWTDCRTDIYSLGVILFQLATGELPYRGNFETHLLKKQIDDAPDLCKLNQHIPRDFSTICLKCLERDPNRRYFKAAEVADELRRFVGGEPIRARPITPLQRAWRWAKRKPALASAGLLTLFVAIAGPTAAVIIGRQNQVIQQQIDEQYRTIAHGQRTNAELGEKNLQLRDRIGALQGRAPGVEPLAEGWQKGVIKQVVDAHYADAAESPTPLGKSREDRVKIHLAIGLMLGELERREAAIGHLQIARLSLEALLQQRPNDHVYAAALAQCLAAIAANLPDKGSARDTAKEVVMVRRRLAKGSGVDTLVDVLVAEWAVISASNLENRTAEQLRPLVDLPKEVVENWPTDPAEIYAAACRLTLHDAVLSRSIDETQVDIQRE